MATTGDRSVDDPDWTCALCAQHISAHEFCECGATRPCVTEATGWTVVPRDDGPEHVCPDPYCRAKATEERAQMLTVYETSLYKLLGTLDDDLVLSDGAQDWTPDALRDALAEAAHEGAVDTAEYRCGTTATGRVTVSRLGADGTPEIPPRYAERHAVVDADKVRAVASAAAVAGDPTLVEICERWLAGRTLDIAEYARVIRAARALRNS